MEAYAIRVAKALPESPAAGDIFARGTLIRYRVGHVLSTRAILSKVNPLCDSEIAVNQNVRAFLVNQRSSTTP